jgi:anti-sigma B factor antagonist
MQIEERVVDDVTILDLKGKITLGEGDEALKDKINSLVHQNRKRILLNLGDVPYIDSAGLGEIVRTYTTVSRQGGQLKLVNLTKRITDLLAITKLLTVFETFESEAEALKSYSKATGGGGTTRSPPAPSRCLPAVRRTPLRPPMCGAVPRRRICFARSAPVSGRRIFSSSPD